MYIAIVSVPDCYVIDFETNLTFLIKPLIYLNKKSGHKNLKYLRIKRAFFIIFKGIVVVKSCLKRLSASL